MDQRWQRAREALGTGSGTLLLGTSGGSMTRWARRLSHVGAHRAPEPPKLRRQPWDIAAGVLVAMSVAAVFVGIFIAS